MHVRIPSQKNPSFPDAGLPRFLPTENQKLSKYALRQVSKSGYRRKSPGKVPEDRKANRRRNGQVHEGFRIDGRVHAFRKVPQKERRFSRSKMKAEHSADR